MMQWKCLLPFTLLGFVLLGCSPDPDEDLDNQMDLFQTDFGSDQSDTPRGMRSGDRARGKNSDGKEVVHGSGMGGGRRRRDRGRVSGLALVSALSGERMEGFSNAFVFLRRNPKTQRQR
mgnify:CR=1 FL=1